MHIAWAVTCRYAESNGVQGTIVGAGVDVLFVPEFPNQVAIMLAVRLTATPDELRADQEHELVVRIEGPDGQPARTSAGDEVEPLRARMLAAAQGAPLVAGWLATPMLALGVQWEAIDQGTYTLVVSIDGGEPSRSPVHVLPAGQMQAPAAPG